MREAIGVGYLAAGVTLIATSAGLMLGGRYVLPATGIGVSSLLVYAAGGLGFACSFLLLKRGLRALQPPGDEVLRKDDRPPILYLRSFIDDSASQQMTRVKLGVMQFVPDPRAEDALAALLNCLGPFVAIGRPGEPLPETGAYRIYVGDPEWKAKVRELMSRCRLTIMLGRATTQGVQWEIEQALTSLLPVQLVFFFPSASGDREQHYQAFRESVQRYFPVELPETLASNFFLRFREGWTPELLGVPGRNPAGAVHASLLALVRTLEPGFQEPPFWKIVPKARVYTFFAIIAVLLILFLSFLAYAIQQMMRG